MESPPQDAARRIGDYVLERELGRGGMGAVFLSHDPATGKPVALKVLGARAQSDPELVVRFRREAQLMISLDFPGIVKAYDVGVAGDRNYMVLEYVEGENLRAIIDREGRIAPQEAMRIMRDVAAALAYGAGRGLVHRDVKPQNIMIKPDGTVKLADMGLAILAGRDDLRLTAPGTAIGTPAYMSPEQARAERQIDARSDIYSLGCSIYHAICGRLPFDGPNGIIIAQKHLNEPATPPSQLVPGLDPRIEAILTTCLQKPVQLRFQSPADLVGAIDEVRNAPAAAGTPQVLRPVTPKPPPSAVARTTPAPRRVTSLPPMPQTVPASARARATPVPRRATTPVPRPLQVPRAPVDEAAETVCAPGRVGAGTWIAFGAVMLLTIGVVVWVIVQFGRIGP